MESALYNKQAYNDLANYVAKCKYESSNFRNDGWSILHYKNEYTKYSKVLDSWGLQLQIPFE